jgi:TRAP-type C4-dicarboxylate transport system substrate-binding protein
VKSTLAVVLLVAVLALIAAPFTACAPSGGSNGGAPVGTVISWRCGSGEAEDTPAGIRQKLMADLVRERTDGGLDITVYYSSVLGDWSATNEMTMRGDLEMIADALDNAFDPRLAISYYMPYLVTSYDEATEFYAFGNTLFNITYKIMEPLGYIPLGSTARGFAGTSFKGAPVAPGDPDVAKGYKIRVMPLQECRLTYERLGYLTTAIPWGEVYSSIQTGICDGQMGGGYFQATYFKDLTDTYVAYNDYMENNWFAVNVDAYHSLPQEYQDTLLDVCQEVSALSFAQVQEEELEFKQVLIDWDHEIVELTPAELEKCAMAIRTDVWPQLEQRIGRDIIHQLYDALGVAY